LFNPIGYRLEQKMLDSGVGKKLVHSDRVSAGYSIYDALISQTFLEEAFLV